VHAAAAADGDDGARVTSERSCAMPSQSQGKTTVAVHAADPLTRAGLAGYLATHPGLTLTATPADADIVVCVPTERTFAALRRTSCGGRIRVVLVTDTAQHTTPADVDVLAVLPRKGLLAAELAATVLALATDEVLPAASRPFDPAVVPHGVRPTPREVDLLQLLSDGFDTGEIAAKLSYSEGTVKNVLSAMLNRLNLRNRAHAVAYAVRAGLI
jgi:DNA-binding CsgD family transcriptional regulator